MVEIADQLYTLLNRGGLMFALIVAVIALATEKIVPGPRYQAALKRIADLEYRIDRSMITAERAVTTTEVVVNTHALKVEEDKCNSSNS